MFTPSKIDFPTIFASKHKHKQKSNSGKGQQQKTILVEAVLPPFLGGKLIVVS
jgi:hypothetical protein